MQIEIKTSVPLLVIFLVIAGVIVLLHARESAWRPTIEFSAALLGGGSAIYALLLNVQSRRASCATALIKRYNDPSFALLRKAMSETIKDPTGAFDEHARRSILNFFEEVALAVNTKQADSFLVGCP